MEKVIFAFLLGMGVLTGCGYQLNLDYQGKDVSDKNFTIRGDREHDRIWLTCIHPYNRYELALPYAEDWEFRSVVPFMYDAFDADAPKRGLKAWIEHFKDPGDVDLEKYLRDYITGLQTKMEKDPGRRPYTLSELKVENEGPVVLLTQQFTHKEGGPYAGTRLFHTIRRGSSGRLFYLMIVVDLRAEPELTEIVNLVRTTAIRDFKTLP